MATNGTGVDARATLLALKACLLSSVFTSSEARVAGALIEHFNRETGQCDPGVERLGELLGRDIRTIERAIDGLAKKGFVRVHRHGGRSNRNSYEILWHRFEELEKDWRSRFEAAARWRLLAEMSPSTRHSCLLPPDRNVSQTDSKNLQNQTYSSPRRRELRGTAHTVRSSEAAHAAAHRRLDSALKALSSSASDYAAVIAGIDDETWSAAVEAECKQRGAGVKVLSEQLQKARRA